MWHTLRNTPEICNAASASSINCKLLKQILMWKLLLFSWIRSQVESSRAIQNSRVGHEWCHYRIYKRVIKNHSCSSVSVGVCGAEGCWRWRQVELVELSEISFSHFNVSLLTLRIISRPSPMLVQLCSGRCRTSVWASCRCARTHSFSCSSWSWITVLNWRFLLLCNVQKRQWRDGGGTVGMCANVVEEKLRHEENGIPIL